MTKIKKYTFYYSVPLEVNGSKFPIVRTKDLTREEFISITGVDPVTNKCIYT